jgi:hypothetical protein
LWGLVDTEPTFVSSDWKLELNSLQTIRRDLSLVLFSVQDKKLEKSMRVGFYKTCLQL